MKKTVSNAPVRVRFAPSPTGYLHIGNLRTALFNWLFARHTNGAFVIRIEDTDQERSKPEYTQAILSSLKWLGITPDEPLVYQSQRLPLYRDMLEKLLAHNRAYRCFCTEEEIVARHKEQMGEDAMYAPYDSFCRNRTVTQEDLNKPHVIRFALPEHASDATIDFDDCIRGHLSLAYDQLDDFIIVRSDGWPTYNFVVVVDDALMDINYVIRGEDHITNTFKQIVLYQALDFMVPRFAHLPLILGPNGNRLSKRDAATAVIEYRQDGFLPDALFNYLVRLGWSHGDQEVFTRQEMIDYFSLAAVGKKGAIFDSNKLLWLNGIYIRETDEAQLFEYICTDIVPDIEARLASWDAKKIIAALALYKDRVKTIKELAQQVQLLHDGPAEYDAHACAKWLTPKTGGLLLTIEQTLEALDDFSVEPIKGALKGYALEHGYKLVAIAQPLRIALVGTDASPGVFELLAFIGRKESLARIQMLRRYREDEMS